MFGAHAFVWGTTSTVVRQRAVPDELLGRVGGVYRVCIVGGMVIGTPLGGLLARTYGLTAPFWFGFVGSALLVVLLWREFDHIAHSPAELSPGEAQRLRARVEDQELLFRLRVLELRLRRVQEEPVQQPGQRDSKG